MHVIFVEPCFPYNQRQFVRALRSVGATVTGIGEMPTEALPDEVRGWLHHYEQVPSVVHQPSLEAAVKKVQSMAWVDRLEGTVEAHMMAIARTREARGIPGTSVETTFLCRDKPAMKEALRKAGVPCAQSTGTDDPQDVRDFAAEVGYPIIIKPRDAAGAANTWKVDDDEALEPVLEECGVAHGVSVAVEEFIEGHEGFFDTITIGGEIVHHFITHYFPGVLEAMRTRWISPQFIATNRVAAESYDEVKEMGKKVIDVLGIGTSATHQEWFFGPKGLKFSEIGARPPGERIWDLYSAANDLDLWREWAMVRVHRRTGGRPSRRFATGSVQVRPDRDGRIRGYENAGEVWRCIRPHVFEHRLPAPGTPTDPIHKGYYNNVYFRLRHPDYDRLLELMDFVGDRLRVFAG